jgi:hypothetical protein
MDAAGDAAGQQRVLGLVCGRRGDVEAALRALPPGEREK